MSGKLLIPLILFLISNSTLLGQDQDFITGRLVDSETQEPIVFATIQVKNIAVGVISNMDGSFKIPDHFKAYGDTLLISSMGYVSKMVLLEHFQPKNVNRIVLDPAVEILGEVIVVGKKNTKIGEVGLIEPSANTIVRKAIEKIHSNYPRLPFSYVGYYRDYQLKGTQYINLNEALMEVFDRGFGTIDYDATKTRMYEYKRNGSFPRDTLSEKPYDDKSQNKIIAGAYLDGFGGNEFIILRIHDPIRNHTINSFDYVNIFDVNFESNHNFEKEDDAILNNEKLYVVALYKNDVRTRVFGRLYVSKKTYAIHKLEYGIYRGGKKITVNELYNLRKEASEKFFDLHIEYKPHNDIMYLNYLSLSNDFQYRLPPLFKVNSMTVNGDRGFYEIEFSKIPRPKEALRIGKYKLTFKNNKIDIDRVEVSNNTVRLYSKELNFNAAFKIHGFGNDTAVISNFELNIKNLRDLEGNRLNHPSVVKAVQFREFFVQRVKPKSTGPHDYLYLNKGRPIFVNQPTAPLDNLTDYWMNTPFQNLRE